MKIFALYNFKGGVGKTSSCVNLSYLAAGDGFFSLLWDLDPQSSATFYLSKKSKLKGGIAKMLDKSTSVSDFIKKTPFDNLYVIPGDIKNRHVDIELEGTKKSEKKFGAVMKEIRKNFDYAFIDFPPVLGKLSEIVLSEVDYVLFPMIPTTLSERSYNQVYEFFKKEKYPVRKLIPFFTMADMRKKLHRETIETFTNQNVRTLKSVIPYASGVEKMGLFQEPSCSYDPRSKASKMYKELWAEIKGLV